MLVRLKVDVMVIANTPGVRAAAQATSTTPIVFVGPDPDALDLGPRLARPGGNITGVSLHPGSDIGGKYLELLTEAVPKASRVAVPRRPENPSHALYLNAIEAAARPSKIQLPPVSARTADDLDTAFSARARPRADALIVLADPIFLLHRQRLADLAATHRLPAMYGLTEHVEAGGLMAYSASFTDVARRAATHVDRILKGAQAGDLPIEQPTRFELIISTKAARTLGLALPPSLLARADRTID